MMTVETTMTFAGQPPILSRGLTLSMAAAAGFSVANIYYNQPMLGIMEHDLSDGSTGFIATATQLGYAAGLFLLAPLGDLLERRALIIGQFLLLAGALAAMAIAPNAGLAILASFFIGVFATATQQIVPFAAHLSSPERRGATVGTVMAGVLCGILFSRTLAGYVGTHAGWREMFWLGVPLAVGMAGLMAAILPQSRPSGAMPYATLIRSLAHLWREFAELRLAAATQALIFAAFTTFWTILALRLQAPRFALGADAAGLFGVVGAVGVLAAPVAGRIADRKGPHPIILTSAALTLASWMMFGLWQSLIGLIAGVVVLDFAVQSALVSNQHVIYALRPEARARINTIFMGAMFLGGAGGSALSSLAWSWGGWTTVCALGMALAFLAMVLQIARSVRNGR
jgi:predicted MFS family arabinose efflux permease